MNASGHRSRSVKTCRTWVSSLAACVLVAGGVVVAAPPASAKVCDGTSVPCAIGDTGPGGGIVFYDAGTRQAWGRYLEAAQHVPGESWCKKGRDGWGRLVGIRLSIGSGRSNTEIIIQACGPDSAAGVAAAYRGGGMDDWFLPSIDELNAIFLQRKVVDALASGMFWSSSQARWREGREVPQAYAQHFLPNDKGRVIDMPKGLRLSVWPVRAF
jgi:hypothetical protein